MSLGGNVLLRWLGEHRSDTSILRAAAAISTPIDVHAGGRALSQGFAMVYTRSFLNAQAQGTREARPVPGLFDREAMLQP